MSIEWSTSKIFAVVLLLIVSGFIASSETSIFSLSRFQLRWIRDRYKNAFMRIKTLLNRPTQFLILITLINEIVNITISTLVTDAVHSNRFFFEKLIPWNIGPMDEVKEWTITFTFTLLIAVPLLLIFGEITPKVIAVRMNKFVAIFNSKILIVLYKVLYPLLWILDRTISLALRGNESEDMTLLSRKMSALSVEEFQVLLDEGQKEGTVNQDEHFLINNVLDFNEHTVADVMTPIEKAFALPSHAKIKDVLADIKNQKYSRIPVYQNINKNIVGIIYVKNLLEVQLKPEMNETIVREFMTETLYVRPDMRLSVLFKRFKATKSHIAVCLNRHGQAMGIVTMEDVLESIFGDIEDERDVR